MASVITSTEELSKKIDKLQNEVSSVEGVGAGVSGTIMILQVLGFVTRGRRMPE
jgi:hypothetical protein